MGFVFLAVNVALAALARFTGVLPIAWEAHLGGFVAGVLLYPALPPRDGPPVRTM
jgi:membrane associated rhomboid family serine protease